MSTAHRDSTSLDQKLAEWRKALNDSACGPNVIAADVVAVADNWSLYKADAGGLTANQFCRKFLEMHVSFFTRRANAMERFGYEARRSIHHEVAVWVCALVHDELTFERIKKALYEEKVKRGGNVPSMAKCIPIVNKILMRIPSHIVDENELQRLRKRVDQLEKFIARNGLRIPK